MFKHSFDSFMTYQILTREHKSFEPDDKTKSNFGIDPQDNTARLIASVTGKILFANPAFMALCNEAESIDGLVLSDLIDVSAGIPEEGEHRVMLTKTHNILPLQFDWVDTQGSQKFLVISASNTTERDKLLQFVTERVQEKNSNIIDKTPFIDLSFDACCISDERGNFIKINENFTELFGYNEENLCDLTLIDLVHPNYKNEFRSVFQGLRDNSSAESISIDTYIISKDKDVLWIEWHHKSIGNKIYSVGRNLTPLKCAKESLERQQRKLNEAEAIGDIGQWEWKIGADAIEFSDQLYKIFDVQKFNFEPTLDSINGMLHKQDSDRMMQVFQRAIIQKNDYEIDFRILRNSGETRYIRCEGRCETDEEEDVIALYGIMQDVTDTTRREMDLRKAKESVERAYAAKTQFLANMSHELRTPLNAVIGFSEMMEQQLLGPLGNTKYLDYIKGIRESGEHLLDLISDILDMSKIEAGKYDLYLEEFNAAKVIRMAVHMMEGRALDDDISIDVDCVNEDRKINADRRAFMQIILNLLSNAVKFSHKNGKVNISLTENNNAVKIKVSDQGIGIPANKLANITMPFEQAESHYTRSHEGSGLGLAITKELAELHGGSLKIDSTEGIGTTVVIKIPFETIKSS
jgi:two-component system cell cycle sensor histidine kinase PleC